MIIGLGFDLCSVYRIKKTCRRSGEKFLDRVFTPIEKAYSLKKKNPFPHLAGMFAAKEAARKAFGDSIGEIGWKKIEVLHSPSGRPILNMYGAAKEKLSVMGIQRTHLSISHDKTQAIAVVIFES